MSRYDFMGDTEVESRNADELREKPFKDFREAVQVSTIIMSLNKT